MVPHSLSDVEKSSPGEYFMRLAVCLVLTSQFFLATIATAQADQDANDPTRTASCDFADDKEISVEYNGSVMSDKDQPHNGKVWLPAGSPMTLFTQVPLILNHQELAVGAYTMYVIPNKKDWTLIVSRNVTNPKTYDEKQDLVRAPMEIGGVSWSAQTTAGFVCSHRAQAVQHPVVLREHRSIRRVQREVVLKVADSCRTSFASVI